MDDAKSYRDGYVEGWRSLMGVNASVPPGRVIEATEGRTPFQEGIKQAVECVVRRRAERPRPKRRPVT